MRKLMAGLALLTVVSCGGSTEVATNVSGNWSGTITSTISGNGALAFTLAQSGSSLTGTWSTVFSNASNNNAGTASGSVNGSSVSLALAPSNPATCGFSVTGTLSGSSSMSGTYAATNCTVAASGTFSATKH